MTHFSSHLRYDMNAGCTLQQLCMSGGLVITNFFWLRLNVSLLIIYSQVYNNYPPNFCILFLFTYHLLLYNKRAQVISWVTHVTTKARLRGMIMWMNWIGWLGNKARLRLSCHWAHCIQHGDGGELQKGHRWLVPNMYVGRLTNQSPSQLVEWRVWKGG